MFTDLLRPPGFTGTPCSASRGFTLIELMVAVVVMAILAAIAIPSYQQYMFRSRRADATSALGTVQQTQERYRANQQSYATTLALLGITTDVSPQGHYTIAITAASATGYTLTATARAGSPQAKDLACGRLQLQMSTGNVIYTGYRSDLTTVNNECWPK